MFQFNRRRMLTMAGAAAAFSPLTLAKTAAAAAPTNATGSTVVVNPPVRIFDSRGPFAHGTPTRITAGQRLSIGLGYSGENSGSAWIAGAFINLTVTDTVGAGFLTIQAYNANQPVLTSNVNWMASGQTIANSSLVPVGGENVIDVICSGGATHFIIDLQGYIPHLV